MTIDVNGNVITANDTVLWNGDTYTVLSTIEERNVVELENVGLVSAVECEVIS